MWSNLARFVFTLIPTLLFCGHFEHQGNCVDIRDVFFDAKQETLFVPLGSSAIVGTSLWEPLVSPRHNLLFFKPESSRSFDKAREWEGITLFFIDPHRHLLCDEFHFLEHLLCLWEFRGCEHREIVRHLVFCAKDCEEEEIPCLRENKFIKTAIRALFPDAKVHTLKSLKKKKHAKIFFERVLISNRSRSCFDGNFSLAPERLERFKNFFFSHCHTLIEPCNRCPRITFLIHGHSHELSGRTQERLLRSLSDLTRCPINILDMERNDFDDVLRIIANTDILLSVHGRGLCHIPFLPKHAAIIEFFPHDGFHRDFFHLARFCGLEFQEVEPIDLDTTLFHIRNKIERLGCN
jgi:hypothetical protein